MIFSGEFVNGIDLVDVCLWSFTLFFFGLIYYLRREDRREGYPLERDTDGRIEDRGVFWHAPKKTFRLPHGRGVVVAPEGRRDTPRHAMARTAVWPGAPYVPVGAPMAAGVGPGSYAERQDVPDLTVDGAHRIAPFRVSSGYSVPSDSADPRGMTVYGADGAAAGKVVDLWVDRSEAIIRYLEIESGGGMGDKRLLPVPFAKIDKTRRRVDVHAILAGQFSGVPKTRMPDSVTRLEEDKIAAYYGAGKLYATAARTESFA